MPAFKLIPPGTVFGMWTVIAQSANKGKCVAYLCRCSCGTERPVRGPDLTFGASTNCGCKPRLGKNALKPGMTFGRWTIVSHQYRSRDRWAVDAVCSCGTQKSVATGNLKSGISTSCGCFATENRYLVKARLSHGKTRTRTYRIWNGMWDRCTNGSADSYPRYGGRGIRVCDRWVSFENFLADMGEVPEGLTIDRIDSNGNYEPGNCRWATWTQQANNRRCTKLYEHNGNMITAREIADTYGLDIGMLFGRLCQGWTVQRAITQPKSKRPLRRPR